MRNRNGSRGIGALAALVAVLAVGGTAACGDRAVDRMELAFAASEPVPVRTMPVDTSPAPEPVVVAAAASRLTAVSYDEAEAAYRGGRYAEAAELFTGYVATRNANAHGHYMLGLASWRSGDPTVAERAFSRSIELDGGNIRSRTNLARLLLEQRRAEEAVTQLDAALELDMTAHEVWRVLGNAYAQLGSVDAALDAYREALILNGEDAWSMNNYGLLLIQLSLFDEAVPPLARAVELMPGSALFHNNLGVALERIGEFAAAATAYETAADAGHERARASLDRVRARVGTTGEQDTTAVADFARGFTEQLTRWREGIDDGEEGCVH